MAWAAEDKILRPLSFPEAEPAKLPFTFMPFENNVTCLFCDISVPLSDCQSIYNHLVAEHKFVVADLEKLASFQGYFNYWKAIFLRVPVADVCPKIPQNNDAYYLLSPDTNPDDLALRQGLLSKRLEWVLEQQRHEREDGGYQRMCLFCRHTETGTRASYVTHLRYQHNLHLGRPDNLVFVDDLINTLEKSLDEKICIYCSLIFKDRDTLKEHMRKKFHKRINPKNSFYDRYFVSSYVEGGQDDNEPDDEDGVSGWSKWREEGSDWSDWEEEPRPIVCLFCERHYTDWNNVVRHLKDVHNFDYDFLKNCCNYYEQVKIVNFIRRERFLLRCYWCKVSCDDAEALTEHSTALQHCQMPAREDWDRPEFFFPTYENDAFLCSIEENEDDPIDQLTSQLANSECMTEECK